MHFSKMYTLHFAYNLNAIMIICRLICLNCWKKWSDWKSDRLKIREKNSLCRAIWHGFECSHREIRRGNKPNRVANGLQNKSVKDYKNIYLRATFFTLIRQIAMIFCVYRFMHFWQWNLLGCYGENLFMRRQIVHIIDE